MTEERLNLIKDNVYTRCHIANITGIGMTAPDKEEVELIEEIKRLNNIVNEFDRYIDEIIDERIEKIEGTRFLKGGFTIEQNYLRRRLHERLQELKGSDKE